MNKIYIKQIYSPLHQKVKIVDWAFSKKEADSQLGNYDEYDLEIGTQTIIEEFNDDDIVFLGTYYNEEQFYDALELFCKAEKILQRSVTVPEFNPEKCYFIHLFDEGGMVHPFEEFSEVLGFNLNLYLRTIICGGIERANPWADMRWLLNITDKTEEVFLFGLEDERYTAKDVCTSRFFCCLDEKWD